MKKILVSFLLVNCFTVFAEGKKYQGLFEEYYTRTPLLSRLTGSDKGIQHIGVFSESEDPRLSMKGHLNYLSMIKHCKGSNLVMFSDVDSNKDNTAYVCATDKSKVFNKINSLKNNELELMRSMGKALKEGGIAHLSSFNGSDDHVFVAFSNLNSSDIDPADLGFKVLQMVKKSQYGVRVIDGYLVKIVTAQNHGSINVSQILPTEEEIQKAKSIISQ
jgi:hypothetical protein